MARNLLLILIIGLPLTLSACITDRNPDQGIIDLASGAAKTFEAYTDDTQAKLVWYLDGEKVAEDTTAYTFTAEQNNEDEPVSHQLVVREENSRYQRYFQLVGLPDDFVVSEQWTINVLPVVGPQVCYLDQDGDTYGDVNKAVQTDEPPANCVDDATDCDDNDASVNPGVEESAYNGRDDDCNAETPDDDLDGDTFIAAEDCDDSDSAVNPEATEILNNGKDDDCNPATPDTPVVVDKDQDGYPQESDCNDNDPAVNPDMQEVPYNGKDDDCKEATRDDDLDGDAFALADDCDDNDSTVNPGAAEIPYNGRDDDCNAETPDDDLDGDSHPQAVDCDDNDPAVNPGAEEVAYNGKDDDCNLETPDDDLDGDSHPQAVDCDDNDPAVNPGAEEVAYNGKDDDCNLETPDDDLDGDGYVSTDDCNDTTAAVYPGAVEVCNGIDDNCDDKIDEEGVCLNSNTLVQDGLNQLIDHLQAYMINGEIPTSVEDIVPFSAIEEIRSNYFEAALDLESDSPAAHFGIAVLELVQIAYDIDSVAIIDFMLNMLTGTSGDSDMAAMAAMFFEILDSTAADYLNNALEHVDYAVYLENNLELQLYLPVVVTDDEGNPVIDPDTGLPMVEKDGDGEVIFETEKTAFELDATDVLLVRGLLNVGLGALHLYRAYDMNIADENGTYDYFAEIKKDESTGKVDMKSLNSFMLALEHNDNRSGFLNLNNGGEAEAQSSKDYFLASIADMTNALDYMDAETDDQSDDIATLDRMTNIYNFMTTIRARTTNTEPPEFSLAEMRDQFDRLRELINSTTADQFEVEFEIPEGGLINLSIDLSGLFAGSITNLHQYLPYRYWFTFNETTAYPSNMLQMTKNIINRVMSKLFDLRLPVPLKDDYPESELDGLTFFGRANNLSAGLVGYSTINIERLLAPTITIVFPDLTFDGIVEGLTQTEVDAVVTSFSSTIFNQEE